MVQCTVWLTGTQGGYKALGSRTSSRASSAAKQGEIDKKQAAKKEQDDQKKKEKAVEVCACHTVCLRLLPTHIILLPNT